MNKLDLSVAYPSGKIGVHVATQELFSVVLCQGPPWLKKLGAGIFNSIQDNIRGSLRGDARVKIERTRCNVATNDIAFVFGDGNYGFLAGDCDLQFRR